MNMYYLVILITKKNKRIKIFNYEKEAIIMTAFYRFYFLSDVLKKLSKYFSNSFKKNI